jgi:hypothetical protein
VRHATEMASGNIIQITSFIKISIGLQKQMAGDRLMDIQVAM